MKATFEKPSCFTHQFSSNKNASSNAVSTGLFLGFSQLNERFSGRVFDQQFRNDLGTIVGNCGFTVGFVEHFVEALGAEGALHEVSKRYGGRDEFLRDAHAAGDGRRRSNNGHGCASTSIVGVRHQASPEVPNT